MKYEVPVRVNGEEANYYLDADSFTQAKMRSLRDMRKTYPTAAIQVGKPEYLWSYRAQIKAAHAFFRGCS